MALTNLVTFLVLDVYDHDITPASVKAIALDKQTRFIKATLTYRGVDYPVDENATVTLTVIRPDKTGVQVTGSVVDVDNADRTGTIKGVYAELSQTALAVKGNLKAQFMVSVGDQILRTEIFSIKNGEALDADVSEWAGDLDGHNLDEMAESIETLQTDMAAVNEDVSDLKEGLSDVNDRLDTVAINNSIDVFEYNNQWYNGTNNGITFTFSGDTCTVQGTATDNAFRNFYVNTAKLPVGFEAGKTYHVNVTTPSTNLRVVLYFCDVNGNVISGASRYITADTDVIIPSDAHGMVARIDVISGSVFQNPTTIKYSAFSSQSNQEISEEVKNNFSTINNAIDKTAIDYFALIYPYTAYRTHNGITFSKGDNSIIANGTATGSAEVAIYSRTRSLPVGFVPDETVDFYVSTTSANLRFCVEFYDVSNTKIGVTYYLTSNRSLTVPKTTAHVNLYINVPNGSQLTNASISISMYRSIFEIDAYKGLANFSLSFPGLPNYSKATQTNYGITFSWDSSRQAYRGVGTATASMLFGFMTSRYKLPLGISAGDKFILSFASTDSHIYLKIRYYTSVEADTYTDANYTVTTANKIAEVPSNCVGISMYLGVYNGFTVDGYVALPLLVPYSMRRFVVSEVASAPKYISFIDDDTSTDTYVTRYYQACMHNGIRGNYAVVTGDYVNQTNDISILKNAEADGFNLALHCDSQETYLRPNNANFNEHNARLNYIRAINAFQTLGIINPQNMWIIPYGSRDEKTHQLASDLGFDIAFTTDGDTYNRFSDTDIYALHRTGLSSSGDVTDDTNPAELGTMARCKARINELVNSIDGGWLIITTHFNEWDDMTWDSTLDSNGYQIGYSRFNELVQYALDAGLTPISLAEGSVKWKEYIHRNKAILS